MRVFCLQFGLICWVTGQTPHGVRLISTKGSRHFPGLRVKAGLVVRWKAMLTGDYLDRSVFFPGGVACTARQQGVSFSAHTAGDEQPVWRVPYRPDPACTSES